MKLVIVESPAKAKTIEKYLGKGYKVKASKGHIVDLPKSGLAVDVDKNYEVEYVVSKPAVLKDLRAAVKGADGVVLAVDPDREGEAIGWHIARELKLIDDKGKKNAKKQSLERIVFTEITKDAVQSAIQNPREIDMHLVDAQQARRVLDRLVGYKLSPLLWKKIRYGLSAGRVQSVAVKLIVDREREREAFKADEYWDVIANIADRSTKPKTELKLKSDEKEEGEDNAEDLDNLFRLVSKANGDKVEIVTEKQAEKIIGIVKDEKWIVVGNETKRVTKNPSAPFSTSSMQQTAANRFKFAASRTMRIAQGLYEAGHITYMRTDSLHLSSQAVEAARKFLAKSLGAKYVPEKPPFYKVKSKVAQEAHEAIRPTNFEKNAKQLNLEGDDARLYDLIRNRALASQMTPAEILQHNLKVKAGEYIFQANAREIAFSGYLEVYPDQSVSKELPKFEAGKQVYPELIQGIQHFTQPPARYSEASLIKELERLGIGRPSTYAPIIHTIESRKYVEKLGNYFTPTDVAKVVTDLLSKHFGDVVDVGFTAQMEDKLDDIANGGIEWQKMIDEFYKPFAKNISVQDKDISRADYTVLADSDVPCPICGKKMVVKLGKNGRFLSCADFPDCKGIADISGETEEDIQKKVKSKDFLESYLPGPKTEDGREYLLKKGRFGEFWAHPDYPKVKDARPLELTPKKTEELYGKPPKTDDGKEYLIKAGKFGKFWAHPDYPKVKDIIRIKKQK